MRLEQFKDFNGDRSFARNVGVILTDGRSTIAGSEVANAAASARRANIMMFAIGVTSDIDKNELSKISTNYFTADDFEDLLSIVGNIVGAICQTVSTTTIRPKPSRKYSF